MESLLFQYNCQVDKMQHFSSVIVLWGVVIIFQNVNSQQDFCYRQEVNCSLTPDEWGSSFPLCYGQIQSPIEISSASLDFSDVDMKELHLSKYYSESQDFTLRNTGRRLQLYPHQDCYLTGSLVGRTYKLLAASFHWGDDTWSGSEHTIDGKQYSMEAHFEHKDSETSNVAVLSILFQETSIDNAALRPIIDVLEYIRNSNTETEGTGLVLASFLKSALGPLVLNVVHYTGSFTSPECSEGVEWYVIPVPQTISKSQLERFQGIQDKADGKMSGNIRPLQPINGRPLYSHRVSVTTEVDLLPNTLEGNIKNVLIAN